MIEAKDFGAVGDGSTDDTAAIQNALDKAGKTQDTVHLPAGTYAVGTLRFHDHIALKGDPAWSYLVPGGTVLKLNDPTATCLLDWTNSRGARLDGVCLDGGRLGVEIHGLHMNHPKQRDAEDSAVIERSAFFNFTGDGVRLDNVWCFTMNNSISGKNLGAGLAVSGGDGFILDNQFSYNHGPGFRCDKASGSMMLTANRIEWNRGGGILAARAWHWNITGNYIDRCGGPGLHLKRSGDHGCYGFTVTGNIIHRCGRGPWTERDSELDCNVRLDSVFQSIFANNNLSVGGDDSGHGVTTPTHGIRLSRCGDLQVVNNQISAIGDAIHDEGGHDEDAHVLLAPNICRQIPRKNNPDNPANLNHSHMA